MAQVLFHTLLLLLIFSYQSNGNDEEVLLGETLVKEALKSMKSSLTNIHISKRNEFETGPQDFGDFKGYLENIITDGLDNFEVTRFDVSDLTINNITFLVKKVTVKGKYDLNGTLVYPLGQSNIHMFGNGKLSAKITNLTFSLKLEIDFESKIKSVKDLDLYLDYEKMTVNLRNFMKSKDSEKLFNNFLSKVNKAVFQHYRYTILGHLKKEVEKIISNLLNSNSQIKDEL